MLLQGIAVSAKDGVTDKVREKPMMLCYAIRGSADVAVDREVREIEQREKSMIPSFDDTRSANPIPVPSMGYVQKMSSDNVTPVSVYSSQGLSLRKDSNCERLNRAKFCLGNLLEGSVYDFKKKNDLRFEIGSPRPECRENCSQVKYEQFYLTFLFRLKL
ncbi:MAG: hypothetical protein JWM68_550 [Verrucomicrobiales bacterium]|nr:hypothetical protein [Verrucomicrobiales bacterium]